MRSRKPIFWNRYNDVFDVLTNRSITTERRKQPTGGGRRTRCSHFISNVCHWLKGIFTHFPGVFCGWKSYFLFFFVFENAPPRSWAPHPGVAVPRPHETNCTTRKIALATILRLHEGLTVIRPTEDVFTWTNTQLHYACSMLHALSRVYSLIGCRVLGKGINVLEEQSLQSLCAQGVCWVANRASIIKGLQHCDHGPYSTAPSPSSCYVCTTEDSRHSMAMQFSRVNNLGFICGSVFCLSVAIFANLNSGVVDVSSFGFTNPVFAPPARRNWIFICTRQTSCSTLVHRLRCKTMAPSRVRHPSY